MRIPAEVTSVEGFVDLVVQLASHGYYFWVQGDVRNRRGLSPEEIDRRQITNFNANLPKRARSYQREPLFPKLAKRRTWLMVKKDLERVGIAYRNEDGIADFHSAGRHTHITELLRNGASVLEAKQLARHSDVRTTMKYTHISLDDQAKALRSLPAPSCQDIVRKSTVQSSRSLSSPDAKGQDKDRVEEVGTPGQNRGSDADCHQLSSGVSKGKKWRRRESNPRPVIGPRKLLRVCSTSFDFATAAPRRQGYAAASGELGLTCRVPRSDVRRSGGGDTSRQALPARPWDSGCLVLGSQRVGTFGN